MESSAKIYPVYFLYGPESYLIEDEIRRLIDRALPSQAKELNLHVFSGKEAQPGEMIQAAQTLPMFSPYRVILIQDADQMEEEEVERFIRYLERPSPTTCLILRGQSAGPWRKCQGIIDKTGKVIEYPRLRGRTLTSWIRERMRDKGKMLTEEASSYIMEFVGDQLQALDNALEKIFLSVGEKSTIELSDVEGIVSEVKVSTIFELTDAIGQKNLEKALGILRKALESKTIPFKKDEETSRYDDPAPLLLSMMARQYRLLWRIKELASGQDIEEIGKTLRMSGWNVRKLLDQTKRFSERSLREGILKCHETDLALKRGSGPKTLLFEKLVIDLCCLDQGRDRPKR